MPAMLTWDPVNTYGQHWLKLHGVETNICVFKGENHELSRSGRPRPRLTRLRKMTEWFDRFLTAGEK